MEIYTINTDFLQEENLFQKYLPFVSEYRKNKVEKLRFKKDKALSLGAGILLAYSLANVGVDENLVTYMEGEHGKPCIKGLNIHFNLSHSGQRAVLIFDESPCGIDIEQVKSYKKQVADRFFSDAERNVLEKNSKNETLMAECFTRIWTRKESYGKFTGQGLNFMDENQTLLLDDHVMNNKGIYFKEYRICDAGEKCDYLISACSANKEIADIDIIDINNMEEVYCVIHRN